MSSTKHVREDFKRRKLKVGKKKLDAANVTNTSFKWAKLGIKKEVELEDMDEGERRAATLADLLKSTKHHAGTSRKEALVGLRALLSSDAAAVEAQAGAVLAAAAERLTDTEAPVRHALVPLLGDLAGMLPLATLRPFTPLLCAYLTSALSKMQTAVRLDALAAVTGMLRRRPALAASLAPPVLPEVVSLLEPSLHTLVTGTALAEQTPPALGLGLQQGGPGAGAGTSAAATAPRTGGRGRLTGPEARLATVCSLRRLLLLGRGGKDDREGEAGAAGQGDDGSNEEDDASEEGDDSSTASDDDAAWVVRRALRSEAGREVTGGSRAAASLVLAPFVGPDVLQALASVPLDRALAWRGEAAPARPLVAEPVSEPSLPALAGAADAAGVSAQPVASLSFLTGAEALRQLLSVWMEAEPGEAHTAPPSTLHRLALVVDTMRLVLAACPALRLGNDTDSVAVLCPPRGMTDADLPRGLRDAFTAERLRAADGALFLRTVLHRCLYVHVWRRFPITSSKVGGSSAAAAEVAAAVGALNARLVQLAAAAGLLPLPACIAAEAEVAALEAALPFALVKKLRKLTLKAAKRRYKGLRAAGEGAAAAGSGTAPASRAAAEAAGAGNRGRQAAGGAGSAAGAARGNPFAVLASGTAPAPAAAPAGKRKRGDSLDLVTTAQPPSKKVKQLNSQQQQQQQQRAQGKEAGKQQSRPLQLAPSQLPSAPASSGGWAAAATSASAGMATKEADSAASGDFAAFGDAAAAAAQPSAFDIWSAAGFPGTAAPRGTEVNAQADVAAAAISQGEEGAGNAPEQAAAEGADTEEEDEEPEDEHANEDEDGDEGEEEVEEDDDDDEYEDEEEASPEEQAAARARRAGKARLLALRRGLIESQAALQLVVQYLVQQLEEAGAALEDNPGARRGHAGGGGSDATEAPAVAALPTCLSLLQDVFTHVVTHTLASSSTPAWTLRSRGARRRGYRRVLTAIAAPPLPSVGQVLDAFFAVLHPAPPCSRTKALCIHFLSHVLSTYGWAPVPPGGLPAPGRLLPLPWSPLPSEAVGEVVKTFPRLLFALGSSPAALPVVHQALSMLDKLLRCAVAGSAEEELLRTVARQFAPLLYTVRAAAGGADAAADAPGSLGPFFAYPEPLQSLMLDILRSARALSPPLRRALSLLARCAHLPAAVRARALDTALAGLGVVGGAEEATAAADTTDAPLRASVEATAFVLSALTGRLVQATHLAAGPLVSLEALSLREAGPQPEEEEEDEEEGGDSAQSTNDSECSLFGLRVAVGAPGAAAWAAAVLPLVRQALQGIAGGGQGRAAVVVRRAVKAAVGALLAERHGASEGALEAAVLAELDVATASGAGGEPFPGAATRLQALWAAAGNGAGAAHPALSPLLCERALALCDAYPALIVGLLTDAAAAAAAAAATGADLTRPPASDAMPLRVLRALLGLPSSRHWWGWAGPRAALQAFLGGMPPAPVGGSYHPSLVTLLAQVADALQQAA